MGSVVCMPASRDTWNRLNKIHEEDDNASYKDILKLSLSAGDVRLVQTIWDELKSLNKGKVGARIFGLIFGKCQDIKNLFGLSQLSNEDALRDPRMLRHTILFQDTFDMIISSLTADNDQLNSLLIAFGSQHSFYTRRGYDPKYWAVFGESLTELLNDDLPTKAYQKRSVKHLWFRVMFFILASVRTGYTIGGTSKLVTTSSRRWWKESRRRHSVMESQLIDVLYVTDPVTDPMLINKSNNC